MRIGELAKKAGLQASAIRYYEQIGLMPEAERTSGGSRRYDEASLERLTFIKAMQKMGFSLEEIPAFLDTAHGKHQPGYLLSLVDNRLSELNDLIVGLQHQQAILSEMQSIMKSAYDRGETCPDAEERARMRQMLSTA